MANPFSFFDQNNLYGANQSSYEMPIISGGGQSYLNQNPEAAYGRFIAPFASGTDPYSNWVRQQFSQIYNYGYKPALATNPDLKFNDQYLGQFVTPEALKQRFMQQAPQIRGLNVGNYGGGRTRWSLQ